MKFSRATIQVLFVASAVTVLMLTTGCASLLLFGTAGVDEQLGQTIAVQRADLDPQQQLQIALLRRAPHDAAPREYTMTVQLGKVVEKEREVAKQRGHSSRIDIREQYICLRKGWTTPEQASRQGWQPLDLCDHQTPNHDYAPCTTEVTGRLCLPTPTDHIQFTFIPRDPTKWDASYRSGGLDDRGTKHPVLFWCGLPLACAFDLATAPLWGLCLCMHPPRIM